MESAFDRLDLASGQTTPFTAGVTLQDDNRWGGLRLERWEGPANDLPETSLARNGIVVNIGASVPTELHWSGHRLIKDTFKPGRVAVFPERLPYRSWSRAGHCQSLVLAIAPEQLRALAARGGSEFELRPSFDVEDGFVAHAARALADDVLQGYPLGPMYGEAIETALLAHLVKHYAVRHNSLGVELKLSDIRKERVIEYIKDQLDMELRLADLALHLQMDVYTFARWFKGAFGIPPHQYVLRERIALGKRLLRNTNLTVVEIALQCGFSSHSHFTTAFSRHVGASPRDYRLSTAW